MKLPTRWSDVTVAQYIAYGDIVTKHTDVLHLAAATVRHFSGCTEEEIKALTIDQLRDGWNTLGFLATLPEGKAPSRFTLEGKTFRVRLEMGSLNTGQYIDLLELLKDKDKMMDNLPDILALMTERKVSDEKAKALIGAKLTMDIAWPILLFFYAVWSDFIVGIARSLTRTMRQSILSGQGLTSNIGVGSSS